LIGCGYIDNGGDLLMKPYYQDDFCTIYHGDCREMLPSMPQVDLVLTDPPYGVNFSYESYNDSPEGWYKLMDQVLPLIIKLGKMTIISGGQIKKLDYFYINYKPDWIICWYKGNPGHQSFIGFNDWEPLLVYGKIAGICMHDYFCCRPKDKGQLENKHPCPKPIKWALWLIEKTKSQTIFDPFMGSGTTLRAAKDLGRKAIGIDLEEKYCEIAAKRLSDNGRLFR